MREIKTNRGRIEIIAHVLAFCAQPRLKTQIMYNARITFKQFQTYASLLSSQGLLARKSQKYVATEKGYRFVQAFDQLQSTLEGAPAGILARGFLLKKGQNLIIVENIDQDSANASQR